ncbi:hypothetical protein JX266_011245 [Neoarthrinium moseri]|nr:hypothetical protein JX266_011245 [Neoarthrinium moseri]
MSEIKRVALAGATGNLGPAVLDQLLQAGLEVTVLTRAGSQHKLPETVTLKEVDYDSLESLTTALHGHDAVVSTLGSLSLSKQLLLVQAAAETGVNRFIPSEFGSNTVHPKTSQLPVFGDKIAVQKALQKEADAGRLTYTIVVNGPFLDWGLAVGFVASVKDRSISLYDGGDRIFSATTLPAVGKAVVGVLQHLDETKNRAVYVQETAITGKQLLDIGQKVTGTEWKAAQISTEDCVKDAWAELSKTAPDYGKAFMNFLNAAIWGEGYGSHFETNDNKLLGIKEIGEEELRALMVSHA